MPITNAHKQTLFELGQAFEKEAVGITELECAKTGDMIPCLCSLVPLDGGYEYKPLAKLIEGDPFTQFKPPK